MYDYTIFNANYGKYLFTSPITRNAGSTYNHGIALINMET